MRGQLWHNRTGREYLIRTIEDVARTLRTEQAHRKAIIAITEGIRFDVLGLFERMEPRPGAERTDIPLLAMMAALRESNVVLYAVDPRGRLQTTEERNRESRGGNPILRMLDPQYHSQESMWLTTEASGGFAIVDTNEIEAGLDRIVADLDSYYLLGFRPDGNDDDWRDLDVRVDRPGLTVRHRKQYKAGAKPPPRRNSDPLEAALEGIIPETALPLRISARVGSQRDDHTEVLVNLQIRAAAANTPQPGALEALVVAVDLDRKKVVKRWSRTVDAATQIDVPIELPSGRYQLRAAVRSARLESIGSVYLTLEIK